MNEYILVIVFYIWPSSNIVMQEFGSEAACISAISEIKSQSKKIEGNFLCIKKGE